MSNERRSKEGSTLDSLLDASLYYGAAFGLFWSFHIASVVLFFVSLGTLVKFWSDEWAPEAK